MSVFEAVGWFIVLPRNLTRTCVDPAMTFHEAVACAFEPLPSVLVAILCHEPFDRYSKVALPPALSAGHTWAVSFTVE